MTLNLGRYGEWALVAGAAEGIGSAFSSILAEGGMNLIMIDHNLESMTSLADELEIKHGIRTVRIHKDLAGKDAAEECFAMTVDLDFRLLIYVPAYSPVRRFMEHSPEEVERFLSINVRSPLKMVHSFLCRQKKGKPAGIILMSSLAGMIGPALAAPYSGTKAFAMILCESLFYELREYPVDVLACCAGPTSTPTYWSSKPAGESKWVSVMDPHEVARYALKNLGKKPVCVPGWKNRMFYFILTRILPRRMAGRIVSDSMFRMYP